MQKTTQGNIQPTVDEQVTAYRWIIASLPSADEAARNLMLQGKSVEAIRQVIDGIALELHKRVVAALGTPTATAMPTSPAVANPAYGSTVVSLNSRRERGTA